MVLPDRNLPVSDSSKGALLLRGRVPTWHGLSKLTRPVRLATDGQPNPDVDKIRAEQAEMARNNPELWKQTTAAEAAPEK